MVVDLDLHQAARSLKACPITYTHPNEATALEGIGPGITGRLTRVLQKYCDDHGEEMPVEREFPLALRLPGRC